MIDKNSTIYAIRCCENGRLYIGKTTNLDCRIQTHFSNLKNGKHSSKLMMEDFKKYGKDAFEVYILEENVPYEQRKKEYEYMRKYNSFDEKYGYNRGDKRNITTQKQNYIRDRLPINLYEQNLTKKS